MLENQAEINIFAPENRADAIAPDTEMEEIDKTINELTDNGKNPGALFPDPAKEQMDLLLDMMGGKIIDEHGNDTGYRTEKQKATESLKSLLDAPVFAPVASLQKLEVKKGINIASEVVIVKNNEVRREETLKQGLLDVALQWISDGKSIIPVGMDKRPLIQWKEFHARIATEQEVRGWFDQFPNAQLGLVTGKLSGLAVVDVEQAFGDYRKLGLPETTVSRTGSGGYHLFYTYVDGVRNKARIKSPSGQVQEVDIRGEGGYVILPPSVSVKGKYEWVQQMEALPAFPVELLNAGNPGGGEIPTTLTRTLEYNITEYPGFGAGQRNDEMTRYIGSLLTKIHPELWETAAWPMSLSANEKNNPPLSEQELRRTFESICQKESVGDYDRWYVRQQKEKEEALRAQLLDDENPVVTLTEAADIIRAQYKTSFATGFAMFDAALNGGFKSGDLVIVTGMSGHGKTTLGQTFTYNLVDQDASSLWFSYEVSADVLDDRFKKMGIKKREDGSYGVFAPKIVNSGEMVWIEAKIKEAIKNHGVQIVFIDLIDFLNPRQRKSSDTETLVLKRIATELKSLTRELGIVTFLMAHVRKQKDFGKAIELQDIAHSSGIAQLSDYVFVVERLESTTEKPEKVYVSASGESAKVRKSLNYGPISSIRMLKNRYTGILAEQKCTLDHEDLRFKTDAPSLSREVKAAFGYKDD